VAPCDDNQRGLVSEAEFAHGPVGRTVRGWRARQAAQNQGLDRPFMFSIKRPGLHIGAARETAQADDARCFAVTASTAVG
jgi:hypothetical protein